MDGSTSQQQSHTGLQAQRPGKAGAQDGALPPPINTVDSTIEQRPLHVSPQDEDEGDQGHARQLNSGTDSPLGEAEEGQENGAKARKNPSLTNIEESKEL